VRVEEAEEGGAVVVRLRVQEEQVVVDGLVRAP